MKSHATRLLELFRKKRTNIFTHIEVQKRTNDNNANKKM